MHSIKSMLKAVGCKQFSRCSKRLSVLALVMAIMAGNLLSFPVTAAQETVTPETETAQPIGVAVCNFKMLESNVEALEAATVATTATYTGDLLALHNVTVKADESEVVLCLQAGTTVKQAVDAAKVTLGAEDMLSVDKDRFVTDGLHVSITRVAYKEYQKTFAIDYEIEVKYTSELRQGTSKVSQAGKEGVRTVTYRDRLENGKVIETSKVKEEVTTKPVKKIILKGTKVGSVVSEAPTTVPLDSAGQPLSYKKKLTGKATAYTSDRGDSGLWTSTGRRAQVGVVAVDPDVIPYGTKLWIVSTDGKIVYGYAIAGDTGGAVQSGKTLVDLYYNTYGECQKFGRRTMNVYIL